MVPPADSPKIVTVPGSQPQQRLPSLKCPFCSGKRFDFGRDIFAGPDQVMYCRKTPDPGELPDKDLSLRMKGAVCLDCGYVAMMVSVEELRAPIPRPADAASAPAREAHAPARTVWAADEEAVKALHEMALPDSDAGPRDVAEALEEIRRGEEGFGDLGVLLDSAEKLRKQREGGATENLGG